MVDVVSMDVAAPDGHGHVVTGEAVGGGGAEPCHYGRGHVTAAEDLASVEVAPQMAASESLRMRSSEGGRRGPSLRTRPWDDRGDRRLCRRGCAVRPWGMSHQTDEAAVWLRCLQALAGKLLQHSHVAQEPSLL